MRKVVFVVNTKEDKGLFKSEVLSNVVSLLPNYIVREDSILLDSYFYHDDLLSFSYYANKFSVKHLNDFNKINVIFVLLSNKTAKSFKNYFKSVYNYIKFENPDSIFAKHHVRQLNNTIMSKFKSLENDPHSVIENAETELNNLLKDIPLHSIDNNMHLFVEDIKLIPKENKGKLHLLVEPNVCLSSRMEIVLLRIEIERSEFIYVFQDITTKAGRILKYNSEGIIQMFITRLTEDLNLYYFHEIKSLPPVVKDYCMNKTLVKIVSLNPHDK